MSLTAEQKHKFIERFNALVPHVKALGLRFHGMGDDWAALELPYSEALVGYPDTGVIAGGAIFSLMDSTAGMAVFTRLDSWRAQATMDLRIDYLKPATPGKAVIGRVQCYKITRRVAFVRGIAYHDDPERPIANVTGTFMLEDAS